MDGSQNGYGIELLSMFFSHFQVAEIFTLMVSLWLGQSAARSANLSTILEHAGFYSAAYMNEERGLTRVLLSYLFSLIIIPLFASVFFLWNALFAAIILYPASLLKIYDWQSSQFLQIVALGTLFFMVGLSSVSIIRASQIQDNINKQSMTKKHFPPRGLRTWIFRALSGVIAVSIPYLLYIGRHDWREFSYWYLLLGGPFIAIAFGDFAIFGYKDSFSERVQALWKRVRNFK